jgi:tetrahydromethanopterin S-methyltransferase subunit G
MYARKSARSKKRSTRICWRRRRGKKVFDKFAEHDRRFDRVEQKIDSLRGEVMTGMDRIVGELEKVREDRAFALAKDREQSRRLDTLEAKVGK